MADTEKVCGTCLWFSVGFCSSIPVMQHLQTLDGGELRTFIERAKDERPMLERCWDKKKDPVKELSGQRARHSATSSTSSSAKTGAFETIERSIKGE